MEVQITEKIQPQAFEKVRARITKILEVEIPNQFLLNSIAGEVSFWDNRTTPIQESESVTITTILATSEQETYTFANSNDSVDYHVIVVVNGSENIIQEGSIHTNSKRDRILGLCRSILTNPAYKGTLGFGPGFIGTVKVGSIIPDNSPQKNDSKFTSTGGLIVTVRLTEQSNLLDGVPIDRVESKFCINETNEGFIIIKE